LIGDYAVLAVKNSFIGYIWCLVF